MFDKCMQACRNMQGVHRTIRRARVSARFAAWLSNPVDAADFAQTTYVST